MKTTLIEDWNNWTATRHNSQSVAHSLKQLIEQYDPEQTGPYLVVWSQFHGGGVASRHHTAIAAIKAAHRLSFDDCSCGCAEIIPGSEYEYAVEKPKSSYVLCG